MNRECSTLLSSIIALISLQACTRTAPPGPTVDIRTVEESNIRQAAARWEKAIAARDVDRILSMYTDDAWELPENGAIAKTMPDRRLYWEAIAKSPVATDVIDVEARVDVARSGDIASQYGSFRQLVAGKNGAVTSLQQKFMNTWRKQSDGSWKVAASMATVAN